MSLWKFFLKIFTISMMTFGGGYTIVPLIREEFVHKENLIRDDEMLELIALSQTAPGPIAVSTALLTGYKLKGRRGAIVGIIAAIPVSYTHLDVYKRQGVKRRLSSFGLI